MITIVYAILFGNIASDIMERSLKNPKDHPYLTNRITYIVLVIVGLAYFFYKKKLKELKIVSLLLGCAYGLMLASFVYLLFVYGTSANPDFVYVQ